jgi:hypothetical protein
MSKTLFVLVAFSIAIFTSGRIVQSITPGQSYSGLALAQEATDQDGTDADQGDVSSEPDSKVKPPNISGIWSGDIDDNTFGSATLTIDIRQKGSKIKGDWMTEGGLTGTFKGKIKSDGMSVSLTFGKKHSKCRIFAEGTLGEATPVAADQAVPEVSPFTSIEGTYTSKKCSDASSGNFGLTLGGV